MRLSSSKWRFCNKSIEPLLVWRIASAGLPPNPIPTAQSLVSGYSEKWHRTLASWKLEPHVPAGPV